MSPFHPKRDALLGALAVQHNLVSKDRVDAALSDHTLTPDRGLGQVLVEQGSLAPDQLARLETLVTEHIKSHDNDLDRSLAAAAEPPPTIHTDYPSVAYAPEQP